MYCAGCGKDIPISGKVCPYCGRDKTTEQARFVAVFPGAIFFALAFVTSSIPLGTLVIITAVMCFGGYALVAYSQSKKGEKNSALQPPTVRVEEVEIPTVAPVPESSVGKSDSPTEEAGPSATEILVGPWVAQRKSGTPLSIVMQDLQDARAHGRVTAEQFRAIQITLMRN